MAGPSSGPGSRSLTITNPLVLYRALLATKKIRPDPAQHRLALQLQQLYFRLKDYEPEIDYRHRLDQVSRLSRRRGSRSESKPTGSEHGEKLAAEEKRKAVFDHGTSGGTFSKLWATNDGPRLAMTRTVPMQDSALSIDSPQGMLLYGEVGRGKSMLLDLLYDSLPTKKKHRWHFNTFMLDMFRRLELARIERSLDPAIDNLGFHEHEHVIMSLARETMATSPILFFDEFQLPDRVAGKLMNSFLISFFHLGGVLIASSNRMPDELAKAQGIEFSRMGMSAGGRSEDGMWKRLITRGLGEGHRSARNDFGLFVEVLKKRCEIWEMEGNRDWRRDDGPGVSMSTEEIEQENALLNEAGVSTTAFEPVNASDDSKEKAQTDFSADDERIMSPASQSSDTPLHYHVTLPSDVAAPPSFVHELARINPSGAWQPTDLTVYARKLHLSTTSPEDGAALLPFASICSANLGPADYISICSSFHTLVVTDIPVLTLLQKNEARRFITLLDACYEARCRLLIEAAAPPDRLFFPETRTRSRSSNELADGDSIESEAFSEMFQDSTAPFRPNVSTYDTVSSSPTMSLHRSDLRSVLADEDADFGPTYGNGRSHGPSSGRFEDDEPPGPGRPPGFEELERRQGPDFTQTGAFTGQDEQFAYKRARSRLWEMCGHRWWERRESRDPSEWWTPVHREGRFWEKRSNDIAGSGSGGSSSGSSSSSHMIDDHVLHEAKRRQDMDGSHDGRARKVDEGSPTGAAGGIFKHDASPYRTSAEPPPKFGWQHAWGMMKWGRKAGDWGKGVEGDRNRTRPREPQK